MEPFVIQSLILIIPIISTLIYLYCCYKLNYWKRRGVHQLDNSHLVFGDFKNGILFRTPPGCHLGEIYNKTPDVPYVGFYIFHKPCLLLKDPEIVKQILITDFEYFCDRHFAGRTQKDSIGMTNLFGLKNPAWKYVRSKISRSFTKNKLKQMCPLMLETGEPMIEYFKNNVNKSDDNKGKILDAQDINNRFAGDLIANIALGTKTDSFNEPDSEYSKFLKNFYHGFKRMVALVTVFFVPELVRLIGSPILFDSSFVRKIFWNAVEEREKTNTKRGDFIDTIIQLKNGQQNKVFKFEGENLMYQSGTFFSGFESSSTTSAFTLMEIARNENIQNRAREDIKKAIDKHGWTYEAFTDMKYLDNCIAEGVRLHPPISTIDRVTLKPYKIPGTDIVIEKGTPIFISLYGIHGNTKYFEEPEEFNPDRFNDDRNKSDAFIPFGVGPRKCIGMQIGQLHVKIVLALILSEYEVYQDPDVKPTLDTRATFTSAADGIQIQFRKLQSV